MTTLKNDSIQTVYMTLTRDACDKNKASNRSVFFDESSTADTKNNTCIPKYLRKDAVQPAAEPVMPKLSVSIPGFKGFTPVICSEDSPNCGTPWLADYIKAIYNYSIIILGVLSVIIMMVGGVIRITAGGNHEQINHGNTFIKAAITGVTLALCSYTILFLLNPNLIILKPIGVSHIQREELAEQEDADANHGNPPESAPPGKACKESEWVNVPNDVNGLGILDQSGQGACPGAIAALKKAATCMKTKNQNYIIRIASASRTLQKQRDLYATRPKGEACNPDSGGCPHMSGVAFDAWGCVKGDGGACKYTDIQSALQDCMMQSGFCLLGHEAWHFEDPKFSSRCGTAKQFRGSYAAPIDPDRGGPKCSKFTKKSGKTCVAI